MWKDFKERRHSLFLGPCFWHSDEIFPSPRPQWWGVLGSPRAVPSWGQTLWVSRGLHFTYAGPFSDSNLPSSSLVNNKQASSELRAYWNFCEQLSSMFSHGDAMVWMTKTAHLGNCPQTKGSGEKRAGSWVIDVCVRRLCVHQLPLTSMKYPPLRYLGSKRSEDNRFSWAIKDTSDGAAQMEKGRVRYSLRDQLSVIPAGSTLWYKHVKKHVNLQIGTRIGCWGCLPHSDSSSWVISGTRLSVPRACPPPSPQGGCEYHPLHWQCVRTPLWLMAWRESFLFLQWMDLANKSSCYFPPKTR